MMPGTKYVHLGYRYRYKLADFIIIVVVVIFIKSQYIALAILEFTT